jgi:hypothetical protein
MARPLAPAAGRSAGASPIHQNRAVILSLLEIPVIHSERSNLHLTERPTCVVARTKQYGVRAGPHAGPYRHVGSRPSAERETERGESFIQPISAARVTSDGFG